MKTRVLVSALIIAFVCTTMSSPVLASQARVTIPTYQVEPGAVVQVAIRVENVTNLYGYQVTINYDPDYLEVQDSNPSKAGIQVLPGTVFSQLAAQADVHVTTPGTILYYAVSGPLGPNAPLFSGTASLLRINFLAKKAGATSLTVTDAQLSNRSSQSIPATIHNGTITIAANTPPPPPPPPPSDPPNNPGPSDPPTNPDPPNPPEPQTPPLQSVKEDVTTTGPTMLSFPNTSASVLIPQGVLQQGSTVTMTEQEPGEVQQTTGGNVIVGKPVLLQIAAGQSPVNELDKPLRIDLRTEGELTNEQLKKLGVYYYDETHKIWVRLPSQYDETSKGFVAEHNKPGIFALLLDESAPAPLAPAAAENKGQTITIQGMAEPLATIELYSFNTKISTTKASITGQYSMKVRLPVGKHTVTLRQIDQAGNVSELDTELKVTSNWLVHIMLSLKSNAYTLNDKEQTLDVAPKIVNGRTMVPLRLIAEALGAEVWWTAEDGVVHIKSEGLYIQLPLGSLTAKVNGQNVSLDVAPFAENGRTLVPVRFVTETLGCEVIWHEDTNQVEVRK